MKKEPRKPTSDAVFAVMGASGTGKSTFIHLLTNDETIRVGHSQDSETFEIQTANYNDQATGRQVMLVDTPGFDDSREGVTDSDILQRIVDYLEPEKKKSRKLNGIIFMHRISDPRVGGVSRKNLRMFQSLCGEKTLSNVRIVTTNWNRVTDEEGRRREADLMNGAFKPMLDAGAHMRRHANTFESACNIMSELIPLEAVTTAIQEEVQAGMTLAQTGAGKVLTADMQELQKKHEREMANLKKDMEAAAKKRNEALRAKLDLERKALEEKVKRIESDRAKLERTVEELREAERKRRAEEKVQLERQRSQWDEERRKLSAEVATARERAERLENEAATRQGGWEQRVAQATRSAAEMTVRETESEMVEGRREAERQWGAEEKAQLGRRIDWWANEGHKLSAEVAAAHENATRLGNDAARSQSVLKLEIVEANRKVTEMIARETHLKKTVGEQREAERKRKAEDAQLERQMGQWADERAKLSAEVTAARENVTRLGDDAAKRRSELERQVAEASRRAAELEKTIEEQREVERKRKAEEDAQLERQIGQWADERRKLSAEVAAARENATRLGDDAAKRRSELELQIAEANRKAAGWEKTVEEQREAERKRKAEEDAQLERQMGQWADERCKLSAEVAAARENATRLETDAAKRQSELERQIAEANKQAADMTARKTHLEKTIEEQREAERVRKAEEDAQLKRQMDQWADERRMLSAEMAAARENAARLGNDAARKQSELGWQIAEANRKATELEKTVEEQREAERKLTVEEETRVGRWTGQWTDERRQSSTKVVTVREITTQLGNDAFKRQSELDWQIVEANRKAVESEKTVEELREAERKRRAEEAAVAFTSLTDQAQISGPLPTKENEPCKPASKAVFAIMGATGTGKSTFIHLLTNDDMIRVGHSQDSETFEIQTANYIDQATGRQVMFIDTPGFDDSREGVTDTDILQKIVDYLEPEKGKSRKLNGIIYMHRISDPRVGGVSRKNLRMFHSLCGEKTLSNVRIVTTNWSRVTEEEGRLRETDLMNGAFKPLMDAGAQMRRHVNTAESACNIMSELVPLEAITTAIQEEVQAGMILAETGAGKVLTASMRELQKKHEQEMEDLKREMEAAANERDQALLAELEHERKAVEEKIKRVEGDRAKLERTVEERRKAEQKGRAEERAELERRMDQWDNERRELSAKAAAAHEYAKRLESEAAKRRGEMEERIAEANRNAAELAARERATTKAEYDRQAAAIAEYERQASQLAKEYQDMVARITTAHAAAAQQVKSTVKKEAELDQRIADTNRKIANLSKQSVCIIC